MSWVGKLQQLRLRISKYARKKKRKIMLRIFEWNPSPVCVNGIE